MNDVPKGGFYYLHTNGELIFKPAIVAQDPGYFDSDFVKKVWTFSPQRETAWRIMLEALALGLNIPRAKELAGKWGLTFEDSLNLLKSVRPSSVTDEMRRGMEIFAKEILGMEVEEYWGKVKERLK